MRTRDPSPPSRDRVAASSPAAAWLLANASPRKPRVWIVRRSSRERSLLVAWRAKATGRPPPSMPGPSPAPSIRPWPAASTRTWIRAAPASIAFSASSLTTAAGRSTTSPAAMPSATVAGRMAMRAASTPASVRRMLSLPGEEFFQGFPGREALQVQLLQLGDDRVVERQAQLRVCLRPFQWALTLQVREHLPGADYDLARQARELGDMDPIAAIGTALDHLVEKDDPLTLFADCHPKIAQPRKLLSKRGQLVIMGGKERQRAKLRCIVEIFEDRLRDAHAVVGAGAATDLVENEQAARRGVSEDVRRLHHFNHEGRQPAGQLIVSADPGEDPIAKADDGPLGGHEATRLRQQDDDAGLPQVGRLAGHVRSAEQHDLLIVRVQPQVVGHEAARPQRSFDQRMAATDDLDPGLVLQRGAHPSMTAPDAGQPGDGIELTQPGGRVEQILTGGGDATAEVAEERLLTRHHRALRIEDEGLLLLQLRRDVALAIDQRLLADVLGRDRLTVGVTDLDVVAEYLVEANLERPDAAPLAFMLLERGDPRARGMRSIPDAVQLGVEPWTKDAPILERRWHVLNQCRGQRRLEVVQRRGCRRRHQFRPAPREASNTGDRAEGLEQGLQVAGRRQALPGPAGDPFQVW